MDLVKITKLENGILFDVTALDLIKPDYVGIKVAKKKFVPKNSPNILDVMLFNDRVVANDINSGSYSLDLTGVDDHYPISHIEGVAVISIEDLFEKFISVI